MALEEKTEQPTDRRREEARRKGQAARSVELSSSLAVLAALITLKTMGPAFTERLRNLCVYCFTTWPVRSFDLESASVMGRFALTQSVMILLPVLLIGMGVAALATAAQVGLVFSVEPLQPQLTRLDPMKGLQRMLSKRGVFELFKTTLKVLVVGYVIWITLREESGTLANLMNTSWIGIATGVGAVAWKMIVRATCSILVIAGIDYAVQRRQHMQELMMTRQELKEDLRRSEGDPTTRSRIRSIMREMARKRMMADVPKADVVITNPVHFAVALKYDAGEMAAPKVVAKGQNLVAEKIKEIAEKHKVPVVRNIPLARSLFRSVEVGREVPLELYEAVAEVLAAVYRIKNASAGVAR
ncbi:MAG: flagellar biosynthesis protein FlhB [Armatimonadetes bacterium]|nr:flagellar biosynthesis protein FlhB [Armatimonadota bacterium]